MSETQPGMLNPQQLAAKLGVAKRTISYWNDAGRLPGFVSVYGLRRWRTDIIDAWIADGCPPLAACKAMQSDANENSRVDSGEAIREKQNSDGTS
jgi:hypothetical protein